MFVHRLLVAGILHVYPTITFHILTQAIKMHTIEGRNFLHKYRLAINSFPKSFFSQASAIPLFTAAPSLPQAKKSNTDPTHKWVTEYIVYSFFYV